MNVWIRLQMCVFSVQKSVAFEHLLKTDVLEMTRCHKLEIQIELLHTVHDIQFIS